MYSLRDIGSVELDDHFYSSIPSEGSLRHFNLENLEKLTLASENCFENFPHAKKVDLRHVKIKVTLIKISRQAINVNLHEPDTSQQRIENKK